MIVRPVLCLVSITKLSMSSLKYPKRVSSAYVFSTLATSNVLSEVELHMTDRNNR